MSRLVHLVADYGPGDLAFSDAVQEVALALPGAVVHPIRVARGDTLAAGYCVADLTLSEGPPGRVVVHDVAASGTRFCVGRSPDGAMVVGPNSGWAWSFAFDGLCGLCYLDVPAPARSRELMRTALIHANNGHPHSVTGHVAREEVPAVPDCAVAYVDSFGNLATTLTEPPVPPGESVTVRIGDVSDSALVTDGSVALEQNRLALSPCATSWRTRAGEERRFFELSMAGGSAAAHFAEPAGGSPIALEPAGRAG
jgi:hypothetical protein